VLPATLLQQCEPFAEAGDLKNYALFYEAGRKVLWIFMKAYPRPCYTPEMLAEAQYVFAAVRNTSKEIAFCVVASAIPGIFNTGGDLSLFLDCIRRGDRDALTAYAHACIDTAYALLTGYGINAVTIGLVEGSALGGGLESALSNDFLLAQKDAKMGLPEVKFNLFPGMGAYSFLSRRVPQRLVEELIGNGDVHTGEWMYEQGVVDRLFEPGEGISAAHTFIDELSPKLNGIRAMLYARKRVSPVSYEELQDITDEWVRAAFRLKDGDLQYMEHLIALQGRRMRVAQPVV
jgi:DSF synthase